MICRERFKAILMCLWISAFVMCSAMALSRCAALPTEPQAAPSPLILPKASVDSIVAASACTSYRWKDRGGAPIGFIKGVAQVFARHACEKAQALSDDNHDALRAYGLEANQVNTYTLLLGLGMRESSGNYGEGYDKSAGSETASEAEAGAFQFSFNSIGASSALRPLYTLYKSGGEACLLSVFQEGAKANTQPVVGVGEGAEFQSFTRRCPAFQVEYAATLIRVLKKHFGPLIRKEAEFRQECKSMFEQIQAQVCK